MLDDNLGENETCSWCLDEVKWVSLRETKQGNLCKECYADYLEELG